MHILKHFIQVHLLIWSLCCALCWAHFPSCIQTLWPTAAKSDRKISNKKFLQIFPFKAAACAELFLETGETQTKSAANAAATGELSSVLISQQMPETVTWDTNPLKTSSTRSVGRSPCWCSCHLPHLLCAVSQNTLMKPAHQADPSLSLSL